jgi:uncharacterized metal-binding protein
MKRMPDAKTHDQIALLAAGALAVPTYSLLHYGLDLAPTIAYSNTLVVLGAHLFGSWWLSPDLDLDSAIDDRWGPLGTLWWPYERLVPHRHFFSHSGISGAFRLVYLYLLVVGTLTLLDLGAALFGIAVTYRDDFNSWLWGALRHEGRLAWFVVAGVIISDLVHVAADLIDTRRKRLFRRRRR